MIGRLKLVFATFPALNHVTSHTILLRVLIGLLCYFHVTCLAFEIGTREFSRAFHQLHVSAPTSVLVYFLHTTRSRVDDNFWLPFSEITHSKVRLFLFQPLTQPSNALELRRNSSPNKCCILWCIISAKRTKFFRNLCREKLKVSAPIKITLVIKLFICYIFVPASLVGLIWAAQNPARTRQTFPSDAEIYSIQQYNTIQYQILR